MALRILLIDEHSLLRAGLRSTCDNAAGINVVGESDRPDCAAKLAEELGPDVVVLGLHSNVQSGIDAIMALRRLDPPVPVLAVTACGYHATFTTAAVVRAGVRGCLTIGSPADELIYAVHLVGAGGVVFARQVAERLSSLFDGYGKDSEQLVLGRLSRRERETLHLIAQGYDNRRIAHELSLAEKTVRNHVSNIMSKLNVPSRAAAVAVAWGAGHAD
jgi:DNA-binding NarL/FixJ family response regulator